MALWVWRFVEGEPPHFFLAPQYLSTESILYIYEVWGGVKRVQWKNTGELKQKHKKQPFSDASASHLSLVVWHV